MHTTKSYKGSPAPCADAVNDIKDWFAERWDIISPQMAQVRDPQQFAFYAEFGGVQGFPVQCWFDLYHGQGAWERAWDLKEKQA